MILVVMAAGMGSRFGGIKQLTPVGPNGELLIDYSIYDAIKAGIEKVVFVIKEEHASLFEETIGSRLRDKIKIEYAYQKLDNIPTGNVVPEGRIKPWGTGHALLSAKEYIDNNFIIINADDFYGRDAFLKLTNYIKNIDNDNEFGLVGYKLNNTLSNNGTVSRGICVLDNGYLKTITERTKIGNDENNNLVYYEEGTSYPIDRNSIVSTNLFGFTPKIFEYANKYFIDFFNNKENLDTREFYLPTVVQNCINDGIAKVKVLETTSKFNGMTYKEDLEGVKESINKLIDDNLYPSNLWGK